MALGNASSSAQARGNNEAVVVKRRKEIVLAKNYTAFLCSDAQGSARGACNFRGSVNNTYFHTGDGLPQGGDRVYLIKRADPRGVLGEGWYLVTVDSTKYSMKISGSNGAISSFSQCG